MRPVVLFRKDLVGEDEVEACASRLPFVYQRAEIKPRQLIIPRYSALPHYKELEADVNILGGTLINSYRQHCYVADIRNWYYDLADMTPRTWFAMDQIPDAGPFVLKGQTNSKKFFWNTHMFANNKTEAMDVYLKLAIDGYVGNQQIYCRQYVPLKKLGTLLNGLPISEEYRFFVLDGEVLTGEFYWSEVCDPSDFDVKFTPGAELVPEAFLQSVIDIVSPHIRFFVVDIARTEAGEWIVIELNDGQQSGLSGNKPEVLYSKIAEVLL